MRLSRMLGAALAATVLAGAPALANPKNALDAYVARPDPAFGWKEVGKISGPGYHGAVLELTSQSWLTDKEVDRTVWKHWLTVIVPDEVRHDKAMLFINGGGVSDPAPTKASGVWAKLAVETHSVVAQLDEVPNQPLRFTEDRSRASRTRSSPTSRRNTPTAPVPTRTSWCGLPMVKRRGGDDGGAAVHGQHARRRAEDRRLRGLRRLEAGLDRLAGRRHRQARGRRRADRDQCAGCDATTRHHWEAMGYFSPALGDYVAAGIIPGKIGTARWAQINRIEDPLNYRDRPR